MRSYSKSYYWILGNQFSYEDKTISSETLWNTADILFEQDSEKVQYIQRSKYYKTEVLNWDRFCTVSLLVLSLPKIQDPGFIWTKDKKALL